MANLEYGRAADSEIEPLNKLLEQALTFPVGTMAGWIESIGHANLRAARRDGRVVAGLSVIPMGHWFGGQSVPAAGVTAVGVAPDQRGTGVGMFLIRRMLEEQHAMGVPIATLYPATTAFYRRAGFERAAARTIYEVPLAAMNLRDYTLEASPVEPSQHKMLKNLYQRKAKLSSSFIDRPELMWNRLLEPKDHDKPLYQFLVSRAGEPEGYVVFTHTSWGEPLSVRDVVALTPQAARRILTLLADHRSMIDMVRFPGAPNDPLLFLMLEQKQKVFNQIDLMLRVLDVPAALAARGYPVGVHAELHLEITDDLLPWNNGRFVLHVADGRARVEPGGQGRIHMHIRDLAALYSGYGTPFELQQAGTIRAEANDLAAAALAFSGPRPWLPDMF